MMRGLDGDASDAFGPSCQWDGSTSQFGLEMSRNMFRNATKAVMFNRESLAEETQGTTEASKQSLVRRR